MTVIPFPREALRRHEPTPGPDAVLARSLPADDPAEPDFPFTETVAAALVVHNLIIEGLHEGCFAVARPAAALQEAIGDTFGADAGAWAEFQFEAIYGSDPYMFLMKLLMHQEPAGPPSA